MTDDTLLVLRGDKCAAVIESICELFGVSIPQATDIYYGSVTAQMIEKKNC